MDGELNFDDVVEIKTAVNAMIRTVGIAIASTEVSTIRVFIFKFLGIA